jgi:Spy/CpxP family protein refolding chaperone
MSHIRKTLAVALLTFGAAAVASAQQPSPTPRAHERAGAGMRGFRHGGVNPLLRGITLSDAEKANVASVNKQHAAQMKALREKYKPQHDAMRAARQRGDTAALRTLVEQSKGERQEMQQLMQSERNDIRGALSAENQAKFDANVAAFQKRAANRGAKGQFRGKRHIAPDSTRRSGSPDSGR